ncbi:hypothetical protein AAKU55_005434 [Oxalobacteraceae bacterium GrIS 1.11]
MEPQEAAAAAGCLQDQAASLVETVGVFKMSNTHKSPAIATAPARRVAPIEPGGIKQKARSAIRLAHAAATAGGDWDEF